MSSFLLEWSSHGVQKTKLICLSYLKLLGWDKIAGILMTTPRPIQVDSYCSKDTS